LIFCCLVRVGRSGLSVIFYDLCHEIHRWCSTLCFPSERTWHHVPDVRHWPWWVAWRMYPKPSSYALRLTQVLQSACCGDYMSRYQFLAITECFTCVQESEFERKDDKKDCKKERIEEGRRGAWKWQKFRSSSVVRMSANFTCDLWPSICSSKEWYISSIDIKHQDEDAPMSCVWLHKRESGTSDGLHAEGLICSRFIYLPWIAATAHFPV
jgi:hypothetical protein